MKTIERPTDETIQQIDFVIQGLENGKYKELAKEVEFHQKLKGADAPSFLLSILVALEEAQIEIIKLQLKTDQQNTDIDELTQRINDLEVHKNTTTTDVMTIGKGIKYAISPDPLDKAYELQEINQWLNNKSIY